MLNRHFQEFIELLEKRDVEYFVVGGYADREFLNLGKIEAPIIGYEALLRNKAASPRAKDKIDLEELRRVKDEN